MIETPTAAKKGGMMFKKTLSLLAVGYVLYHLFYSLDILPMFGSGALGVTQHLGIHMGGILFFTFLIHPVKASRGKYKPRWYDVACAFLCLVPTISYAIWGEERTLYSLGLSLPFDAIMGWMTLILCVEATRRAVSPIFATLVAIFAIYPLIAQHSPWIFHTTSTSFWREGEFLYLAADGMFGVPVWTSATLLLAFILFAQALLRLGMGEFLIDLAQGMLGHVRGGPAKVGVVASGFFGMISGSAVANAVAIGSFTIPMMKKIGYRPHIAAAIECCAGTGGQYMPPVMGAAIFVLCAWINMAYRDVIIIAAIPALLYYLALFIQVDLEAAKQGLVGLPKDQLPRVGKTFRKGWWFIVPIILFLVLLIVLGWSAAKSCLYSILLTLLLSVLRKSTRPKLQTLQLICEETAETMTMIATACLAAGIIIGCVSLTGIALKLSAGLVAVGGENLILLLVLGASASLILGMGLSSIPCYIFLALLLAPALERIGIPTICAHLFVFYYGVLSFITPPVAMAAYAAAGIANASPIKTGYAAMRFGMAAYIIPFAFCTQPAILLIGTVTEIIWAIFTVTLGISTIAIGFEGYMFARIGWVPRIFGFAGGALIVSHIPTHKVIGFVLIGIFAITQVLAFRESRKVRKIPNLEINLAD